MKKFNPEEHMITVKGKKYLRVMWRLVWFREEHPDWTILTEVIGQANGFCMFKASVLDETGRVLSTGHGSETKGDFGDYIEKAETKAVGRCLATLGYGTQFSPDLDEEERIVDSPVQASVKNLTERFAHGVIAIMDKVEAADYDEVEGSFLEPLNLVGVPYEEWTLEEAEAALAAVTKYYKEVVNV